VICAIQSGGVPPRQGAITSILSATPAVRRIISGPGALRITGSASRDRCQTPTDEPERLRVPAPPHGGLALVRDPHLAMPIQRIDRPLHHLRFIPDPVKMRGSQGWVKGWGYWATVVSLRYDMGLLGYLEPCVLSPYNPRLILSKEIYV
jgi:hypothetical protein